MGRRFSTLDGMRGVAALAVFTIHSGPLIAPFELSHAYLAVDFFFMLSGFVLSHAYGAALGNGLSAGQFMAARYVRLYPLYLLGTTVGIVGAGLALALGQGSLNLAGYGVATTSALLMLPSPTWSADAAFVPFNYPAWSLIFELLANLIFAFSYRWLTTPRLAMLALFSGIVLAGSGIWHGTIDGGAFWPTWWTALPRVMFCFFVGVLIQRGHRGAKEYVTRGSWLLPLVLIPLFTSWTGSDVTAELWKIFIAFPLIIWVGSRVEPRDRTLFTLLGVVSYPLYVFQIPVIQFIERALTVLHISRESLAPWGGLTECAALVLAALVADRLYDRPVRKWLAARLARPVRLTVTR